MARIDDVCTVLWLREGWWPVGELPGPLVLAEADPWGADTVRAAARSGWQVLRRGARFAEIDCRAGSLLLVDSAFEVGHGVAAALAAANAGIAFADEQGFHKPAWNLDLALEQDLVGGVCLIGRGLLAGRAELGVEAPHDVALRLSGVAGGAALVPVVGGVWRGERRVQPGMAAVRAVLPPGAKTVPSVLRLGRFRIAREVTGTHPMVSVVVPTKDNPAMLRRCLEGVLRRTAYPAIEVVVADNGAATPEGRAVLEEVAEDARVRVVSVPGAFNYAHINNVAATVATGEVLVLMNDDVDVIAPGWLAEMVGHALRPEVGAVGAKLLYPDGTVQHGGIVLGVGNFEGGAGIAGHFGLGEAGGRAGMATSWSPRGRYRP